jgi:hypothetical protein
MTTLQDQGAPRATLLDEVDVNDLRWLAGETAGPHVDPSVINGIRSWWRAGHRAWSYAMVGREFESLRDLTWVELYLLHVAHEAEPTPPPPPAAGRVEHKTVSAARAVWEEARREWQAIAEAFPVPVHVAHNYTSHRHNDGFTQGGDHIVVREELHVGRLVRPAKRSLCCTESYARQAWDLKEIPPSEPSLPNCKGCIRTAYRVVGRPESAALVDPRAQVARVSAR